MTSFKALYGYDPNLWIDTSPKDSVYQRGVLVVNNRIIHLIELRQQLRDHLL